MILQRTPSTNRLVFLASVLALAALAGCSEDDPAGPDDAVCSADDGLGVRVEGRAEPLEVCLADEDVSVLFTTGQRYDVAGQLVQDGDVIQVRMVFTMRDDFPATLELVDTVSETASNADAVWLYYEEAIDGTAIESVGTGGGTFRLSFSDADVIVGTLTNVSFTMRDVGSGDPAGQRRFPEGFFSLTVKEPTAATLRISRLAP